MSPSTVAEALASILAERARMGATSEALRRPSVPLRTCNGSRRPSPPFTKELQQGRPQPDPSHTFSRPGYPRGERDQSLVWAPPRAQHVVHKRRKTEGFPELEAPADLEEMEIPLKDMGDVIVLTRLYPSPPIANSHPLQSPPPPETVTSMFF